jgi:hypothetical protein
MAIGSLRLVHGKIPSGSSGVRRTARPRVGAGDEVSRSLGDAIHPTDKLNAKRNVDPDADSQEKFNGVTVADGPCRFDAHPDHR